MVSFSMHLPAQSLHQTHQHHHHFVSPPTPNPFLRPLFSIRPSIKTHSFLPLRMQSFPVCSASKNLQPEPVNSSAHLVPSHHLKIAVIGFGNYGQFLAKTLVSQGHTVLAHSRSDHSLAAKKLGVSFFSDPHDLCEEHPEVILLCTSIISTEQVLKSFPLQRLKRNTLFVDVLSVKEFAKNVLLEVLPNDFDILCTHPMFGPQSGREGWAGMHFMYEKVRVGNDESRISRCDKYLDIFAREGCRMVEMSCAEHDQYAAGSQFVTHTIGRLLKMLELESTPINTKGYESLLNLVENTAGDSFELYYGLFMYNKSALEMLEKLELAFEALRTQLFGSLHEVVRNQLFGKGKAQRVQRSLPEIKINGNGSAVGQTSTIHVRSTDALETHKYIPQASGSVDDRSKLKIGIVGFGNFGQFLAKTMVRQGHTVSAYSRTDYSDMARKLGVSYFSDADDFCEDHPEVILLCTSILSTEKVLRSLPLQRLKRSTLFVDVLSVKEFPRKLFFQHLPPDFDILCTHPMFGPESGKNGWSGLTYVFDRVRVGHHEARISRCHRFLDIFAQEGCQMVEMSCAEHDWHAAGSQFITHTVGRILEKLGLESTPINTKGYETLLKLVKNTAGDSFDLYYGLFMYNANAMEHLERLDFAAESLQKQLIGRLHGVLRKQLFEEPEELPVLWENPVAAKLSQNVSQNGAARASSSEVLKIPN